jgi:hypothetical protein
MDPWGSMSGPDAALTLPCPGTSRQREAVCLGRARRATSPLREDPSPAHATATLPVLARRCQSAGVKSQAKDRLQNPLVFASTTSGGLRAARSRVCDVMPSLPGRADRRLWAPSHDHLVATAARRCRRSAAEAHSKRPAHPAPPASPGNTAPTGAPIGTRARGRGSCNGRRRHARRVGGRKRWGQPVRP